MKNAIIRTVDYLTYLLFAFVFLVAGFTMITGNIMHGIVFLVTGWIVASMLSGFWFVLSAQAENTTKTNELLRKLLDK